MQASDSKTTVLLRRPGYVMRKLCRVFLPFLESQPDLSDIDAVLCEYIELQWARGESLYFISDGLSGLHFFWPELRGILRNAWRYFKTWRRIEAPARAPPITVTCWLRLRLAVPCILISLALLVCWQLVSMASCAQVNS